MSALKFHTIGLIGRHSGDHVAETLKQLDAYLRQQGLSVLIDDSSAGMMLSGQHECVSRDELGQRSDLVIVVGGDGTLLTAARTLVDSDTSLVGINLGHLGFLADISPVNMEQNLDEILRGDYLTEERFLLEGHIHRGSEILHHSIALNDIVVHKWNVARMIEIQTYIDGHFVSLQRSDGLIVASPTGSTAYALSAGGPIIHPTLNALVLVPVCPQSMSNRPIVIGGDSQVKVVICEGNLNSVRVTCDGQIPFQLEPGDTVHIRKKQTPIRLIHPKGHNHYEMLRAKLNWAETPKRR